MAATAHSLPVSPKQARNSWGVLAALSLAMMLPSLATSIANAALPALAEVFAAPFQTAQWIVLIYLLVITTLVVAAGRWGDLAGRRRLLLAGIALFTTASLLCASAPALPLLIAARGIQGAGAAIMMALTMALVGDAVPKAKTGVAMGLLGTMSAVGTALGPALGGLLIAWAGWPAIFLVNVPLGALAFVLAYRCLPGDGPRAAQPRAGFDSIGTALLLLTLAAYAMAMTMRPFGLLNLMLLTAALAVGLAFLIVETRVASPLIQLRLLRSGVLRASLATSGLVSTVMMTMLVIGPFYLSGALGLDAAATGMVLSAGPLVATATGVPAGRLVDRFGPQRMAVVSLGGMIAATLLLGLMREGLGVPGYIAPIMLLTGSYAIFQAANNTAIMAEADARDRGLVSGMLNLARNLGLVTGASAMGAAFAFAVGAGEIHAADPQAVARGARCTFALASILIAVALVIALRHGRSSSAKGEI
ncbi:MFS transporter [Sphingomonas sp.]|jgi:MFS family permease|uniref:MFS transporter n=1 Tax=Sphingomonas sp. TaxID=28214 RepID=UPI002ED949BB